MARKKQRRGFKGLFRKSLIFLEIALLIPLLMVLMSNQVIRVASGPYLYDLAEEIPYQRVGLVLGTSPRIRSGAPNPYFHHRMEAAARLYHSGKVSYLIVSGDNRTRYYNEPAHMKQALRALDVPEEVIYSDNAGLRTLDSMLRAREVFGLDSLTVVSQRFHNQRAVYIGRHLGLEVVAMNASGVKHQRTSRVMVREWFAKAKVFYDLFLNGELPVEDETVTIGGGKEPRPH